MNIAAKNYKPAAPPIDDAPLTDAERLTLTIKAFSCELAAAVLAAGDVTPTRCAPIDRAKDKLQAARFYWHKAVERGASPEQLARMAADGKAAAAAVAAAEPIAAQGRQAKADRAIARAAKAAAKMERDMVRLRLQRDYILKGTTGQAARHVASTLAGRGLFADAPTALAAIVAEVVKTVAREAATPEHILQAWIALDPRVG